MERVSGGSDEAKKNTQRGRWLKSSSKHIESAVSQNSEEAGAIGQEVVQGTEWARLGFRLERRRAILATYFLLRLAFAP